MKKIVCNVMALAMVASLACSATACGSLGTTVVEEVDKTKVQLYIASYSGGGGYKWLDDPSDDKADDAEKRFEDMYANTKFGDKTGVQVIVEPSKEFDSKKVGDSITSSTYDLYFAPANFYQHVAEGDLLDITDVVTETNPHDNKTIESKMDADQQSLLKVDDKYYGLPYYTTTQGITYDADLFNEDMLYFSDQIDSTDTTYPGTNAFVKTKNATNLSCGPDAVFGTYDDGLPSTYQEFYKLMDRMISGKGGETIIPFVFNGQWAHYTNMLIRELAANYVGVDGMKTHVNFNSNGKEVEIVTGFNGDTPIIEKKVLTEENAYLIKQSAGLYYASEFCQKIFTDTRYYDTDAAGGGSSNIYAQERFLKSGKDGSTPSAMIIEGDYWYNESISEGVMARANKYGTKNLKVMALPHQYKGTVTPKAEGEAPISQVLMNASGAYAFIAADIKSEREEVAKLFLQFCYSDEELAKAELSNNGIGRPLTYDTSSVRDQLPSYAKSVNAMREQAVANGTYFNATSQHPIALRNPTYWNMAQNQSYWKVTVGTSYNNVYSAFKEGKASVKGYFLALGLSQSEYNSKYYAK